MALARLDEATAAEAGTGAGIGAGIGAGTGGGLRIEIRPMGALTGARMGVNESPVGTLR